MTSNDAPDEIHKTRDVFGITRDIPLNYFSRTSVDTKFVDCLSREKHLIIQGLQEIEWVFSATSERWEHACEHLEPQVFLVA